MRKATVVLMMAAFALAACNVQDPFGDGEGAATPASPLAGGAGDGAAEGATTAAGPDGKATLSMTFRWADGAADGPARSVTGADGEQIRAGEGSLRNFFQMILVDTAAPDQIWDFNERESTSTEARPTLKVGFLPGHSYGILILMGHDANDGEPPTLLSSGYAMKTLEAGENKLEVPLVPIVVGAAFTHYGAPSDVRQPGRLARTVGLDAGKAYSLVYTLGSATRYAGDRPGDALREVTGDGVAPLRSADKAAYHGIDDWVQEDGLRLVSNAATYAPGGGGSALTLPDWYDTHGGVATNGMATYTVEAGTASAGPTAGSVYFNMVYAPFGFGTLANWKDRDKFSHQVAAATDEELPRWVIRNGLSDAPQDANTDFAAYPATGNVNGAISVGVVDSGAARPAGLFEDNNPWPLANTGITGQSDGDLDSALSFLNAAGVRGKYGEYTIRLGATPTLPANDGKITLGVPSTGSGTGADVYANIKNTSLIIEGVGATGIVLPPAPELWTLASGNTVRYGSGIVLAMAAAQAPDIAPLAAGGVYGLSEPAAALSVTASSVDGGVLSYQWYRNAANDTATGTSLGTAPGAQTASYTPSTANANKGKTYYYVKVTNTVTGNGGSTSESLASDTAEVWVQTLAERVAAAAGTGSASSPASITLYQSELLTDGNGFAAVQAANIGANTHISIVSNNAEERVVQLDIAAGGGAMFLLDGGGSLTLGGSVTLQGDLANTMSLVFITGSGFTMSGSANITGNQASSGGGVCVSGGGAFTMNGSALISGNTATGTTGGGGVSVSGSGSRFEMSGRAAISGNQATNGGGVYVAAGGAFAMSDSAEISGNIASAASGNNYGGGVYVTGAGSTFTMEGSAAIIGNAASAASGAKQGGGVWLGSGASFTMDGSAVISGNQTASSASQYGGGVYALGGNLTMKGNALITGNTTKTGGGGVYVAGGTFIMEGGAISHNTITGNTGGGVYLTSGGSFKMYGGTIWGKVDTETAAPGNVGGKVPDTLANSSAASSAAVFGTVSFEGGNGYVGTTSSSSGASTNETLYVP